MSPIKEKGRVDPETGWRLFEKECNPTSLGYPIAPFS
jgi:hypothetical protein